MLAGLPGEEVFIPPRRCRISLHSPPFPAVQREEGLWYSRSTSYHDLITWPEHKGRSVSSEMSPLFLDLAQELTHQNCLRKKKKKPTQLLFFFFHARFIFFHWLKHNISTHECKKFSTSPRKSYCLSDTADDFPLWTN